MSWQILTTINLKSAKKQLERKNFVHDNSSNIYNSFLGCYEQKYSDFSDKRIKATLLSTTLVSYFLMIMNMVIILMKKNQATYHHLKVMKKNIIVYHPRHYQKMKKKEKD